MQEFQSMYDANVACTIVYNHTKFGLIPLKIKEIIAKSLTCVRVLVKWLYQFLGDQSETQKQWVDPRSQHVGMQ